MDLKLELVPADDGVRVVQLTPPGSACSIMFGTGLREMSEMRPGLIKTLHLVVADINEVRKTLAERGVEMGEVIEYPGGINFAGFSDPDGNS